ncbi:MAG: glycosyltransferase 87 family protein [Candidatus Gastranaerophilales bacterium]|nr:glycosyltransferase 87 family protein [Candidatus Gastranaerophilales bacterium]
MIHLLPEITFDWQNYRLYNVWALFHDRLIFDYMPTTLRCSFVPFLEIPNYVGIKFLNNYPNLFLFLSTIDSTVAIFLTYKISALIFRKETACKNFCIIMSTVLVMFTPLMIYELSFEQNDMPLACFIMGALYLILKYLFIDEKQRSYKLLFAGILIGTALGLKLVACVYVLTFAVMLILYKSNLKSVKKDLLSFFSGVFFSFLALDSWWFLKIYNRFGNPFFPYFNNIFHSDKAPFKAIVDIDFGHLKPRNIIEILFYPFFKSNNQYFYGIENFSFDYRYPLWYISSFVLLAIQYLNNIKGIINKYIDEISDKRMFIFILLFTLISYFINLGIFSAYRYIIPTTLLFGITIVIFISVLINFIKTSKANKNRCLIIICLIILCTCSIFSKYYKFKFYSLFFKKQTPSSIIQTEDLKFEDNSTVILVASGTSFMIPFQNPNCHYMGFAIPETILKNIQLMPDTPMLYGIYWTAVQTQDVLKKTINSNKKIYILSKSSIFTHPYIKATLNSYSKQKKRKLSNCKEAHFSYFDIENDIFIYCEYN